MFGIFAPKIGEDEPILTSIVFKWVETTTTNKINMEPENDGLEDDFPFQLGDF